ncbi:MAG: uroporphyrinogen-III synthase [Nitrincola lacisaponensis]|uniref:uroporphyrinogen-III synthase n=1 Tax=Nitrincola lacisaponensis TaxID=267850 RepID=UPI00391D1150
MAVPGPLQGQSILVTRPGDQNVAQCQLIESLGGTAISLPLLCLEAVTDDSELYSALKHCLLDLDLYAKVIFVSPNAARLGAEKIDDYWPQRPVGIDWIGIGQQTTQQLQALGFDAWCCAEGYDSETLLATPQMQQVEDQRILILRGDGGRDLMRDTLTVRGAKVDYGTVYYRRCPSYSEQTLKQKLVDAAPSALLITSGEGLTNLQTLISGHLAGRFQTLYHTLLVVPSKRIAQIAENLGYQQIKVASGPDDYSMVRAILPEMDWNSWHDKQI